MIPCLSSASLSDGLLVPIVIVKLGLPDINPVKMPNNCNIVYLEAVCYTAPKNSLKYEEMGA